MGLFSIVDFDRGINNQDNPEITGKFTDCINFDIDKRGQLVKREQQDQLKTEMREGGASQVIKNVVKWVHSSLSGGAEWIAFIKDNTTDKIVRYPSNWGAKTDRTSLSGTAGSEKTRFIPFSESVRFANGRTRKPGILQYIDRQWFFGNYVNWSSGSDNTDYVYGDATPSYPTTWSHLDTTVAAPGANPVGYYYYKFTAVFDGYQEALLPSGYSRYQLTSANQTLNVPIKFNTSNWNKRITAVKLYRSFSPTTAGDITPVYYHVKTIPVNTASTHDDVETDTVAHGSTLHDPDATFDSGWVNKWATIGNSVFHKVNTVDEEGKSLTVTTKSGGTGDNLGFETSIWGGSWSIFPDDGSGEPATGGGATYSATNGYAGKDILYNDEWIWTENERKDWNCTIGSEARQIIKSEGKVIQLTAALTVTYSTSASAQLSNGYYYTVNGANVQLNVFDTGLIDGASHPMEAVSKINTNYKYAVKSGARLYAANVKLDPDGASEDHKDWLIYSELNAPDILPITNYIQLDDLQGGEITGIAEMLGNIIVFMEKGIFSLNIPSEDPQSWSLRESDKFHGCIAPESIIKVGSTIFYAGKDNVYALDSNFEAIPIANDIKDVYQAVSNLEDSEFIYDEMKDRIICKFGTDKATAYNFDVLRFLGGGDTTWTKYTFTAGYRADHYGIDENLKIYTINETDGTSTSSIINQLYGGTGDETSITASYKTSMISNADMREDSLLRWINTSYTSDDDLSIKIYRDRSDTADSFSTAMGMTSTLSLPENLEENGTRKTGTERFYTNRVGRWAKFVQVELISDGDCAQTTVEKMEIETS